MNLQSIFSKPVDRPIEGVIKADDEAKLRIEFEEYVLTNEVQGRLESFLDAYNNYEGANGVWISGFFGSGKSHLLKILALLLENRLIDGVPAIDLFLPKCEDEIFRADLKKAVAVPSRSILFNIDQKADVINKTQTDALVAVFFKVFYEMCGYYGKQGHIAQFERDLDHRGLFQAFRAAYAGISQRAWEKGREQSLFESRNIARAYAQVTGEDESLTLGILDKYRSQHHLSIEDFADQVQEYIDRQPAKFRLNFFVDEVGQFIADNVKMMTNLQTIAESLATKCQGRAWVVVTSQNDMTTVLGEMNRQQTNDFSKIMARFKTKMLLTSTNVAEVIQKRLLAKTPDGIDQMVGLYHQEFNHFGTLFSFTDGSRSYKNYRDRDDFVRCYPFVPYQFELFQSAIENLSRHNAFEGKHSSVGERSMLAVFQQVAIQIETAEIGQLATFDLMFEGIGTALKTQTQKSISAAERQLGKVFAVQLLKALFLVKYVNEFKPTLNNICVLMLGRFGRDLPKLRRTVLEALSLLEQQTYIRRNGELYEYLTDEEKDVEQEIKNTEIDAASVAEALGDLVFERVLRQRKIRYEENGQDYIFSRKLDDRLLGKEYELTIHVISPIHEHAGNEEILKMHSTGRDELLVVLPQDDRLYRELLMYKRTDKYIRQTVSVTQQDSIKRILTDKGFQNRERYTALENLVGDLIGQARLFVGGNDIASSAVDPQTRIGKGFQSLIAVTYPNLRMLRGFTFTENDVGKFLNQAKEAMIVADVLVLSEAEQEMLGFINTNKQSGLRTTIKTLLDRFERKPYGWYFAAILCNLAKLCARGKLEVREDGNLLEDSRLEPAIRNTHGHGNVILEPQIEFTQAQIRAAKVFFNDFFDAPPAASEAKALGREIEQNLGKLKADLTVIAAQVTAYPFVVALQPVLARLKEIGGKPYSWYLTDLIRDEDSWLDRKEQVIDPIRKFMGGSQKEIFSEAQEFLRNQQANFDYIPGENTASIRQILSDLFCFKNGKIQTLKMLVDSTQVKIQGQLATEKARVKAELADLQARLAGMADYNLIQDSQKAELDLAFSQCLSQTENQTLIAMVRDRLSRFAHSEYPQLMAQVAGWAEAAKNPPPSVQPPVTGNPSVPGYTTVPGNLPPPPPTPKPVEFVSSKAIPVHFNKAYLADATDIDQYLAAMRRALLAEVEKGKRIQI